MSAKLVAKANGYYYIEGTIRAGGKSHRIRETTGCRIQAAASLVYSQRIAAIERQLLLGESPSEVKRIVPDFATAAADYIDVKPHLGRQDRNKLLRLGESFAGMSVDQIGPEDWENFVAENLDGCAPSTIRRWFAMFSPPLQRSSERFKFPLPKFELPAEEKGREIFLEPNVRDGLLAAYPAHARSVALMLCLQGCRHFEALRLDWRDVSFARNTLTFRVTKNGEVRVVPMHTEVRDALQRLHCEWSKGAVFLTPSGKPYTDRREASHGDGTDGSGIRRAHASALRRYTISVLHEHQALCRRCKCPLIKEPGAANSARVQLILPRSKAGQEEFSNYALACRACEATRPPAEPALFNWFRIHDWRHHWASWFIMDGGDAPSLMALGGWKNPKMVQRYVKLSVEHLSRQLNRSQARTV